MLFSLAAVTIGAAPQIRIVSRSGDTEPCAIGSETKRLAREPLALFAALEPQKPLFMGSTRVAELRSLGEVDAVAKGGKPTVIMFYAPWCPHCRNTKPVLDTVAERLVNIEFKQIDASRIAEVRGAYGVTAYPTIKYYDSVNLSGIKYQWHGANEDDLRGFLERTALSSGVVALAAPGVQPVGAWAADLAQPSTSNVHPNEAPAMRNASGTMELLMQALEQAKRSTPVVVVVEPAPKPLGQENAALSPLSAEALADVRRLAKRSPQQAQAQPVWDQSTWARAFAPPGEVLLLATGEAGVGVVPEEEARATILRLPLERQQELSAHPGWSMMTWAERLSVVQAAAQAEHDGSSEGPAAVAANLQQVAGAPALPAVVRPQLAVAKPVQARRKLKLKLYGESMCPFTADFVVNTLAKATEQPGIAAAIDFDYVPWGNAYTPSEQCGGVPAPPLCNGSTACLYDATARACFASACGFAVASPPGWCFAAEPNCQHGASECRANRIQACAAQQTAAPANASLALAHCMFADYLSESSERMHPGHVSLNRTSSSSAEASAEANANASGIDYGRAAHSSASTVAAAVAWELADVDAVAAGCAHVAGLKWASLQVCADGKHGEEAVRAQARKTPMHDYVPWVELDGVPLFAANISGGNATDDDELTPALLVQAVCDAIPLGDDHRPAACAALPLAALRSLELWYRQNATNTHNDLHSVHSADYAAHSKRPAATSPSGC